MRIAGRRTDGALHLALGGGLSIILRGEVASPPTDEAKATKMGPWHFADDTLATRQVTAKRLDQAKVVPLFNLSMSFDEQRERVCTALRQRLGLPSYGGSYAGPGMIDLWIPMNGLGDDWVVYCVGNKHYVLGYMMAPSGAVEFDGEPEEVVPSWQTLAERAAEEWAEETTGERPAKEGGRMLAADKNGGAGKKKKTSWWTEFKASRSAMKKLAEKPMNYSETARTLRDDSKAKSLAYEGPHPFSWCMDNVVPAMEEEGKGPDDPEAFCAWWKGERSLTEMPGSLPNLGGTKALTEMPGSLPNAGSKQVG